MLAFVITFLSGIYLLGPGLLARWILGLFVSARVTVRTRSEDITRALLLAILPFAFAIVWATKCGKMHWIQNEKEMRTFFACVYSDKSFDALENSFYPAVRTVLWMNWSVFWRLYLIIFVSACLFTLVTRNYGRIINWPIVKKSDGLRAFLTWAVLDQVSHWHIHLSPFALANPKANLQVDVVTTHDVMFQGTLTKAMPASDGKLAAVMLSDPRKFDREPYLKLKNDGKNPKPENYWRPIPSETFIISGSEIATINIREVLPADDGFLDELQKVLEPARKVSFLSEIRLYLKNRNRTAK